MATAEQVRAVRERVLAAEGARLVPVAIGPREGLALRDRVVAERATRTLEIGLGWGVATLFLCEGLLTVGPAGRHLAADPYQLAARTPHGTRFDGGGLRHLEQAGVRDLVEFHAEESQLLLPRLLADGRRFDLAFVDGNHRFEAVFLDLVYCGRLLPEGSVAFVDDVQLPGVRRAVRFCVANLGWRLEEEGAEGEAHAWAVLRTGPAAAFDRPFGALADF